jgi:hypothetical protein
VNWGPPLSVEDLLHRHAREAALELQAAAEQAQTELDRIRAELEAQRKHLEGVVAQARQAQERLVSYTPVSRGHLICPRCFLRLGEQVALRPILSPMPVSGQFICPECTHEVHCATAM